MNNTTTFTQNETSYTTYTFDIKNTIYKVCVVKGKHNYINVNKISQIRSMGKDFKTFDDAANNYKNPQIKIEILKIELGL